MTIHIPKPIAITLGVLFGGAIIAFILEELPDGIRYAKFEGM